MALLPICRLMDGPAEDATILVDLNESEDSIFLDGDAKGEVLGAPDLSRGHDESTRTIKLGLVIDERHEFVVSQVANAVQRDDVWLHWQRNSNSAPVWFKLLGVPAGGLNMDLVLLEGEGFYEWNLTLLAEGFAYGARVTETIPLTYRKWDGTTDTTNISARLQKVLGDAPTRARIDVHPENSDMVGWAPHLSVAAVPKGAWEVGPQVFEVESMSGLALGSGYTAEQIAFGGATPVGAPNAVKCPGTQNTGYAGGMAFRGDAAGVLPGTYKVMLRVLSYSSGAVSPSFKARVVMNTTVSQGDWGTWRKPQTTPGVQGGYASMLNAGLIQVPAGFDPEGLDAGTFFPPSIWVDHRGDGGTQPVWVDQMALIPVRLTAGSASTLYIAQASGEGPAAVSTLRVDDLVDRIGIVSTTGVWNSFTAPRVLGAYPVLTPGLDNWLTLLPNTNTGGQSDSVGADTFSITVSYHPRYLHLGGQ